MTSWVVLGAGYAGGVLAKRLVDAGHDVIVTRRDPGNAAAAALVLASPQARGLAVDLTQPATLGGWPADSIVVCTAPPGIDPAIEMAALIAQPAQRIVYLSSTAVYGPGGGAWVDESWPMAPMTSAGRARAAAEAVLARDPRTIALRVTGIWGPGRGLVDRIRARAYRIIGDGSAHVSRIHVEDLVEAIVRAGTSDIAGPINIADDDPAPIGLVADTVAAHFGLPPPPRVAVDTVDPEVAGMLTADRRIMNRRMTLELGVVLRYPSWRIIIDAV